MLLEVTVGLKITMHCEELMHIEKNKKSAEEKQDLEKIYVFISP